MEVEMGVYKAPYSAQAALTSPTGGLADTQGRLISGFYKTERRMPAWLDLGEDLGTLVPFWELHPQVLNHLPKS